MKLFILKWSKSIWRMQVLAHNAAEAKAIAKAENKKRLPGKRFGVLTECWIERDKPGIVGYTL
jgi:hypothetical protein